MKDLAAWLDDRSTPAPPSLRREIDALLAGAPVGHTHAPDAHAPDAHADRAGLRVDRFKPVQGNGSGEPPAPLPVWDRLADAALSGLAEAAAGAGHRATAGRLLAVDALLTYAFEAAAEAGEERVKELTDRLDWERFEGIARELEE